jgi:hypothetical protein
VADRREVLEAGLSLFALSGLALAQPLLSLLSDNATFFVVRGSTAGDIVLLAVLVALAPPLILFALEMVVYAVSAPARRWVHAVLVTLLTAVFVLQVLKSVVPGGSGAVLIGTALVLGAGSAVAYGRFAPLRMGLNVLSPLPVLAGVMFLFFSPVTKIVLPEQASASATSGSGSDTPVVMVVLDELDGDSLMRPDRRIDAQRFPNFAKLARGSDWFRNTTSIADVTELAVPGLLSGVEPKKGDLPIQSDHPDNLFTLLGSSHDMNVSEQITTLCPEDLCDRPARPGFSERIRSLGSDVRVVWLHHLLPDDMRDALPSIDRSWGEFEQDDDASGPSTNPAGDAEQRVATTIDRPGSFRRFTRAVHAEGEDPQLSFLHVLFPHVPYEYLPSGRQYSNSDVLNGLVFDTWFDATESLRAEQRYILQLQALDGLLGELLSHLRRIGIYDSSLVVVTADHGVSFGKDQRRRTISPTNAADVATVPLFMKLPGQRRGRTIDRHISTIDILPAIAEVLGLRTPWVDGRSALDPALDRARTVTYSTDPKFRKVEIDSARLDRARRAAVSRQAARVGVGREIASEEPGHELIGRSVRQLAVSRADGERAVIDQADEYPVVDLRSRFLPAFVTGGVTGTPSKRRDVIAIALNGRIAAVTRLYTQSEPPTFDALLPEKLFRQGLNRVRVYRVDAGGASPSLALLGSSPARAPRSRRTSVQLHPGSMEGFAERLTADDNRLEILGWAVESATDRPASRVLAYAGDKLLGEVRPSIPRPDLAADYGRAAAARAGFRLVVRTVQARQLVQPGVVRVVAVRGRNAAALKRLPD